MLENLVSNQFEYKKLTESEQKARGILGRLVGPIADMVNPTRNGRKYSNQLWENVFENPIMKEKIANRCCFGELNHPSDRTEIDMEKVAICLAEQPKKGKDGLLYGVFDILSTPNGKILKALCDYGCKIGISSRGQGDLITDSDGDEAVDPDTYDCECFDAVLIPGVEAARLKYVTESLDTKKSLKQTLTESLESASDNERVIMKETLENLNLLLEEEDAENEDIDVDATETEIDEVDVEDAENVNTEISADDVPEENDAEEDSAESDSEEEIDVDQIELDLLDISDAENADEVDERTDEEIFLDFLANNFEDDQVKEVCKILDIEVVDENEEADIEVDTESADAEDSSDDDNTDNDSTEEVDETSDEDIDTTDEDESEQAEEQVDEAVDDGTASLVHSLKEALKDKSDLEGNIKSLQEKLAVSDAKVDGLTEECNRYKSAIARLSTLAKSNKDLKANVSALEESLAEKEDVIKSQKTRIARLVESRKETAKNSAEVATLTESLSSTKQTYETEIKTLNEKLTAAANESNSKISALNESLAKANSIKESYRNLANKAVNKYIEVKADILGVTPKDIKRKLGESYTMEDVDQVCEDLKSYQLNVSRLPFSIDRKVSVRVNENMTGASRNAKKQFEDDDVDAGLIKLANFDF